MTSGPPSGDRSQGTRLPTFLVVGAPKSGTTSLAAYLGEHPDVFMSPLKEPHYFDLNYDRGLDWYRAHFAGSQHARAVGEATPTYFLSDDALSRAAALLPDARLVLLLRHPIDAVWSNFWFQRSLRFERRDLSAALRQELAGEGDPGTHYLWQVRYVRRIERVLSHWPREALIVRTLDDLSERAAEICADVYRHIGVDDTFVPPNRERVYNPSTRLRSERLREWMLRYRAWRRMPRLANAVDRWNRVRAGYPPMDPTLRARVAEALAEDTAALGRWLGRDLSHWMR